MFVEVIGERPVGGLFVMPPPWIGLTSSWFSLICIFLIGIESLITSFSTVSAVDFEQVIVRGYWTDFGKLNMKAYIAIMIPLLHFFSIIILFTL